MPEDKDHHFNMAPIYKDFVLTSLPSISLSVISVVTDFVATWILSKYDQSGIAAGGLISSQRLLVEGFVYGFLLIVAPLASGIKDSDDLARRKLCALFHYGLITSLLLSVPMTAVYYESENIFLAEGQDGNATRIAGEVFRPYCWGAWADSAFVAAGQFAMARNETVSTLSFLLLGKIGALFSAYYWCLGSAYIEPSGPSALGKSYAIFSSVSFLSFYAYLLIRKVVSLSNIKYMREHIGQFRDIFKYGWQVALYRGSELSLFAWMVQEIGRFSVAGLSSSEIATRYASLPVVVFVGLSQAVSVSVSKESGREGAIANLVATSLLASLALSVVCCCVFIPLSDQMTDVFLTTNATQKSNSSSSLNSDEVHLGVFWLMVVTMLTNFFDGPRTVYAGHLRGRLDTTIPMVANVIQSVGFVGLSYLLLYTIDSPALSVFLSRGVFIAAESIYFAHRSEGLSPVCRVSLSCLKKALKTRVRCAGIHGNTPTKALTVSMVESGH